MTATLYLRCVSHNRYIESGEVGRDESYLPQLREAVQNRDNIVARMEEIVAKDGELEVGGYLRNIWQFLYTHPICSLEVWDTFGRQHSLTDEDHVVVEPVPMEGITDLQAAQVMLQIATVIKNGLKHADVDSVEEVYLFLDSVVSGAQTALKAEKKDGE